MAAISSVSSFLVSGILTAFPVYLIKSCPQKVGLVGVFIPQDSAFCHVCAPYGRGAGVGVCDKGHSRFHTVTYSTHPWHACVVRCGCRTRWTELQVVADTSQSCDWGRGAFCLPFSCPSLSYFGTTFIFLLLSIKSDKPH
jgi:hypothetical protein